MTRHTTLRTLALSACAALLTVGATGCGFVQSAAEIEIGEGKIPRVAQDLAFPNIDELTGDALATQIGETPEGDSRVPGFPTSIADGTLAHVQGLLSLAGDCQQAYEQADLGGGPESSASNLRVAVTNCTADDRCDFLCNSFAGLVLEAGIQLRLLNAEQAANLKDKLANTSPDAIVQLRLQFYDLALVKGLGTPSQELANELLDDFELILSDDQGAELVLLDRRDLDRIATARSGGFARRFEFDNNAQFTKNIKAATLAGAEVNFNLNLRIRVPQWQLYEFAFEGAGFKMDVQPEIVISALEIVKGQL
jgi:hypothetical protein